MADPRIEFDAEGLRVSQRRWFRDQRMGEARWNEVARVVAANTDALTHDQIWLLIETTEGRLVRVSEFWRGFADLRDSLPSLLPHADETWWLALNSGPAFQERRYLVWERS